ncbi:hypothetical protein BDV95DRAFT_604337 [Massariosphaeria phaeospora]|uniref:Uncharacterized protein n=1 Tax=Massariosphaeria phaeospora TaxID=100035 RepID=A0A7C8MBM3_9PLEO|nr:hypothetical protein BDV95DRAFT_604337 [Massariosphaeria phaeospora]
MAAQKECWEVTIAPDTIIGPKRTITGYTDTDENYEGIAKDIEEERVNNSIKQTRQSFPNKGLRNQWKNAVNANPPNVLEACNALGMHWVTPVEDPPGSKTIYLTLEEMPNTMSGCTLNLYFAQEIIYEPHATKRQPGDKIEKNYQDLLKDRFQQLFRLDKEQQALIDRMRKHPNFEKLDCWGEKRLP